MVQNPKGGGLSSSVGGSQMLGGVQKTSDFLDKSTWTLATTLIVLVLLSSLSFSGSLNDNSSKIIDPSKAEAPKTATPAPTKPDNKTAPANATTTTETKPAATPATTEKK
jgi:preprotein translocase subunit SecG